MQEKDPIVTMLHEEYSRWEELLDAMPEEQIVAPQLSAGWSIKDVVAHLMAWQQVSIARLEAARSGTMPVLPAWFEGLDPEAEEDPEELNATLRSTYCEEPWSVVHASWRDGFLRFLYLAERIPADELFDTEKYQWLRGYSLYAVLQGSYVHHHDDHYEPLLGRLNQQT